MTEAPLDHRRSGDELIQEVVEIRRFVQSSKEIAEELRALLEENRRILLAIQRVLSDLRPGGKAR